MVVAACTCYSDHLDIFHRSFPLLVDCSMVYLVAWSAIRRSPLQLVDCLERWHHKWLLLTSFVSFIVWSYLSIHVSYDYHGVMSSYVVNLIFLPFWCFIDVSYNMLYLTWWVASPIHTHSPFSSWIRDQAIDTRFYKILVGLHCWA